MKGDNQQERINKKLQEMKLDRAIFYNQQLNDNARMTVCLLVKNLPLVLEREVAVVSRGVAIQSPSDQFCKKLGRKKSFSRAVHAVYMANSTLPILLREGRGHMRKVGFAFKSCYSPALRRDEISLISNVMQATVNMQPGVANEV